MALRSSQIHPVLRSSLRPWLGRQRLFLAILLGLGTAGVSAAPSDFDTNFGGGLGYVYPCLKNVSDSCFDSSTWMTVQDDGRIVVAGSSDTGAYATDWIEARFDASGNLDTTFAGSGMVQLKLGGGQPDQGKPYNSGVRQAVVRPDRSILAAGWALDPTANLEYHNTWLISLNADGSYDPGYAQDGKQVISFGEFSQATALAMLPNGTPIIAGMEYIPTTPGDFIHQIFVLRGWIHGGVDPRVGGPKGFRLVGTDGQAMSVTMIDNKLLIHYYDYTDEHEKIMELNPNDGTLVPEFGTGGIVDVGPGGISWTHRLVVLPNDKIVGFKPDDAGTVYRLNKDGSFDTTFNGTGTMTVGFNVGSVAWVPTGELLAVQGGGGPNNPANTMHIARITTAGVLDPDFFDAHGNAGVLPFSYSKPNGTAFPGINQLMIQPDGRIVFSGELEGKEMVTRLLGQPLQLKPNAFGFVPRTGVPLNATEVSGTATIRGLTPGALVPISVEGGELVGGPGSGYVRNGDTIAVTHQSAATSGTSVTTTVRVGGLPGPTEAPWNVRGAQVVATFTTTTR